jgi:hypothetical protein
MGILHLDPKKLDPYSIIFYVCNSSIEIEPVAKLLKARAMTTTASSTFILTQVLFSIFR